jgi:hypothetical protein
MERSRSSDPDYVEPHVDHLWRLPDRTAIPAAPALSCATTSVPIPLRPRNYASYHVLA